MTETRHPGWSQRALGSRTHAARGGTLVSCDQTSGADRGPTRTPVRLAHTSPRIGAWLFGTDGCCSGEERSPCPRDCQPPSRRRTASSQGPHPDASAERQPPLVDTAGSHSACGRTTVSCIPSSSCAKAGPGPRCG
uniref:Uncharacterized protein n=1 Tax=Anas platyrhynchos TaxID=8839 RepID=A0A8B9SSJ8_ANAPL